MRDRGRGRKRETDRQREGLTLEHTSSLLSYTGEQSKTSERRAKKGGGGDGGRRERDKRGNMYTESE